MITNVDAVELDLLKNMYDKEFCTILQINMVTVRKLNSLRKFLARTVRHDNCGILHLQLFFTRLFKKHWDTSFTQEICLNIFISGIVTISMGNIAQHARKYLFFNK